MELMYKFISLADLEPIVDPTKELMVDTETIGFYGKIRLAQFYQRHFPCVYIVEYPSPYELAGFLGKFTPVFHNAHYDITTIQEQMGHIVWMPEKFHCTFLLARLHFYMKKDGFSLDEVINYVLGENPYGHTKKDMQQSNWAAPVLSEEQLNYAALDVMCLQDVWDVVKVALEEYSYKLDYLMTRYCLDFQNNGLPFSQERLNATYEKNMKRIKEIGLSINCNSYQQVRPYIGSVMSDGLGLAKLTLQGNTRAAEVQETRKLTKNNSFLSKFMNEGRDGYIFGKFKCSPRSGRTASEDQNLQQLPRNLKHLWGFDPDGDEVIIVSDFAQMQLRNVCVVTGDKTMERLFREGEDLHGFVARMIFGENYTKEHRQIAKTFNFGALFGAGATVLQAVLIEDAGIFLTEVEILKIKAKWLKLWIQISEWQVRGIKAWKKGEIWETPLGRKYTAKMMTDQLAMQIQGFEAEVAKLALHYMWPKMAELNATLSKDSPKVRLLNFPHDCYIWASPKIPDIYQKASRIIAECMQEAWKEMCQGVLITDLPMPVNVRVGFYWGDIEKAKTIGGDLLYELSI